MNVLGNRLKAARNKKKLTQRQLAAKLNISQSTIALYETGNRNPDPDTLNKFADFFSVSVDYLLGRNDDQLIIKEQTEIVNEQLTDRVSDSDLRETLEALKQKRGRWGEQPLSDEQQEMLANIIEAVLKRREEATTKDH